MLAQSRPTTLTLEPSPEIIDQIEALKQQLRVYADDFQSERSDRERVQSEKDALKETLDAVQEQVLVLEEQVSAVQYTNLPIQLDVTGT